MLKFESKVHGNILLKKVGNKVSFFSKKSYGTPFSYKDKNDLVRKINNTFHYDTKEKFTFDRLIKYISAQSVKKIKIEKEKEHDLYTKLYIKEDYKTKKKDIIEHELAKTYRYIKDESFIEKVISETKLSIRYSLFLNKIPEIQNVKKYVKHLLIDTEELNLDGFNSLESISLSSTIMNEVTKDELTKIDEIETFTINVEGDENVNLKMIPDNVINLIIESPISSRSIITNNLFHLSKIKSFKTTSTVTDTNIFPNSIEIIDIYNLFTEKDITFPDSVNKLKLYISSESTIKRFPENLTKLKLKVSKYVKIESFPSKLKILKLESRDEDEAIGLPTLNGFEKKLPFGLKELIIHYTSYSHINIGNLPTSLETLSIGKQIRGDKKTIPENIKNFACFYTENLKISKWPTNLERLIYLINVNDIVITNALPRGIKEIHVSKMSEYNFESFTKLESLSTRGFNLNKRLQNEHLKTIYSFSQDDLVLPEYVDCLYLFGNNNIDLGKNFEQYNNISELVIDNGDVEEPYQQTLPRNLKTLKITNNIVMKNFPSSLEKIETIPLFETYAETPNDYIYLRDSTLVIGKQYKNMLPRIRGENVKSVIFENRRLTDKENEYKHPLSLYEGINILSLPENHIAPVSILPMSMKVAIFSTIYLKNNKIDGILYKNPHTVITTTIGAILDNYRVEEMEVVTFDPMRPKFEKKDL